MAKLQDKLCDALTLVGLLAVIGVGTSSLLPERSEAEAEEEEAIETPINAQRLEEVVEEIPMHEDPPTKEENAADTQTIDSFAVEAHTPASVDTMKPPSPAPTVGSAHTEEAPTPATPTAESELTE